MQDSSLFESMGGISPDPSTSFGNTAPDMSLTNPSHTRYASASEHGQSGSQSQLASPDTQLGGLSTWPHSGGKGNGKGLLEHLSQGAKQGSDRGQALSRPSSLVYDDRLWSSTAPQQQLQQQNVPTTRHQQPY